MLIQFLMAYSHPHPLTSCSTMLDGLRPSPHMWSAGIITNVANSGHLVEVEELYMNGRNTRPPRRGGRIVHCGAQKKGGRVGPMLIQFLMAYSHPHTLTSCSTMLDGLRPSPHMWSADILTNIADHGHLVEVEELYMQVRNTPPHLVEVEEL